MNWDAGPELSAGVGLEDIKASEDEKARETATTAQAPASRARCQRQSRRQGVAVLAWRPIYFLVAMFLFMYKVIRCSGDQAKGVYPVLSGRIAFNLTMAPSACCSSCVHVRTLADEGYPPGFEFHGAEHKSSSISNPPAGDGAERPALHDLPPALRHQLLFVVIIVSIVSTRSSRSMASWPAALAHRAAAGDRGREL